MGPVIPGTPPRDYSLAAESPTGHIRNALMVLTPRDPSRTQFEWRQDAATVRRLLEAALALLERTPGTAGARRDPQP